MTTVGVRGLRGTLSQYLAEVKRGHTVTITEHGTPIARLVPIGAPTALETLRKEGRIIPATSPRLPADSDEEARSITAMVSDLVAEQRR